MKKRSREINVFSMSALDLFASAMGAFILITVVLFPFFLNLDNSLEGIEKQKAELERERAKLEQERTKADNTKAKEVKLQRERARLEQEKAQLKQERAKLEQEKKALKIKNNSLEERVKFLQRQIDDTSVLLGIKTKAKKFVIAVDMSGSIYQPNKQDYRQFIKLSVQDMLASFQSQIELVMIGFHAPNSRTQLHYWPENRYYFKVQKNTQNRVIYAIDNWMNRVDGGTPTREALIAALSLNPEEIILLSDGAPSEDWRQVVNTVTGQNNKKIPIHAVAVGDYVTKRDFIDFLVQLTKRNNGYFVGAKPG